MAAITSGEAIRQSAQGCRQDPDTDMRTPDPRTITWERLEKLRLHSLGLSNKYSRHFNVLRTSRRAETAPNAVLTSHHGASKRGKTAEVPNKVNSIAPFATLGKPTCGYFFSEVTENRKLKFGIPPSDLVKWRSFPGTISSPGS